MLNPWGRSIPDLSKQKLTLDQKTWLANRVITGVHTAIQIQQKSKILLESGFELSEVVLSLLPTEGPQKLPRNIFLSYKSS